MTITIHGANDGAKITGDDSGSVTETRRRPPRRAPCSQATWTTPTTCSRRKPMRRTYGTFRVDANGKWTYVLDNGNETVDALNVDETLKPSR
ncbi:VCBS domain-containing protein [Vibrio japonicus]|uniref:VCBS domain-containing protein n=1 Tax=Vibrio japonicus TaxID=1824638 RepID=A0ABY5LQ23_9VIBR|nr:VCBS domain-containing protein [Vibrio japonicus]